MSWKYTTQCSWLVIGICLLAGCRLGATADRNIQIHRQADSGNRFDIAPETRLSQQLHGDAANSSGQLAHSGPRGGDLVRRIDPDSPAAAGGRANHSGQTAQPAAVHASLNDRGDVSSDRVGSQTAPADGEVRLSLSDQTTVDLDSTEAQLMQAAGLADADMQELLSALRESPAEVRQQAVRQLIAAASLRANPSQAPVDINQRLSELLDQLPALPEEIEATDRMPIRLGQSLAGEDIAVAAGTGDGDAQIVATATGGGGPSGAVGPSGPPLAALELPIALSNPFAPPTNQADASTQATAIAPVSSSVPVGSAAAAAPLITLPTLDDSAGTAPIPAVDPVQAAQAAQTSPAAGGTAAAPLTEQELYGQLLDTLSTPVAGESDGERLRRELAKRYLLVLTGDPDTAVQSLDGLSQPEQEFLRYHLLALWNLTDPEAHPVASRRFGAALPHYQTAVDHLRRASDKLEVRSLALCTEIVSFGQVTRFAAGPLDAGQKVILYCEIDNFIAERTDAGYVTELHGSYELFDAQGVKVSGQVLPTDRQTCDHYLRDYFIAYQMNLPAQLAPGAYRLVLTMECGKGKKYGQASLPLEIR